MAQHAPWAMRLPRSLSLGGRVLILTTILLGAASVSAENNDDWIVVFTPQVWLSHIDKNGFSSPPPLVIPRGFATDPRQFTVTGSPGSALDTQWGTQIIAYKHPWTIGAAVQYVSFITRYDIATAGNAIDGVTIPLARQSLPATPGQTIAQERVDSDRFDVDLALTYFVPDVVKDRLDFSAGLGVKVITASASRHFANGVLPAPPNLSISPPVQYLYVRCGDALTTCRLADRVRSDDVLYGITVPLNIALAVTADHQWTAKFNVAPFLGGESRNDHDVVYATQSGGSFGFRPRRLDGATLAYGGTSDLGIKYTVTDRLQAYGAFRVQFLEGHERYLAWGPMVNLSIRLGR
jgi:hypothetical protein